MERLPFASPLTDDEIRALGITAWGVIDTADITFLQEVRDICAGNGCGGYGKTWACPPGVGTLEECKAQCLAYSKAFVFSGVYELEDCFDLEGMQEGHRKFQETCKNLHAHLRRPYLMLGNEGCKRCKTCTYPDAPCRFPETLSPSVEGYGIFVYDLAKKAGVPYRPNENTVAYFGMICY